MGFLETLALALGALRQHRGRSFLTVLSITIGAFAIVVMSSLAESGLKTLRHGIEELGGARIMLVAQKKPEHGEAKQFAYGQGISITDRDAMLRDVPHVVGRSRFARLGYKEVLAESGRRGSTYIIAADAGFLDTFVMKMARGRGFTEEENRGRAPVCIVGKKLAEKVGPSPTEPLGGFLTVGALRCRVVGVLADNDRFGVGFGFDWNDLVVSPSEAMNDVDENVLLRSIVMLKTDAPTSNDLVKRLMNARMTARHPGVDDFQIFDFSTAMASFDLIFRTMEIIVALLAAIALVIGGIGVMNMMLVAVSERVKEIGIRKALGARPRAIGAQFLLEATALSVIGGGTGVLLGIATAWGAALLIARFLVSWQTSFAPMAIAFALVVSTGIGIGFGWLPAKRAAALDPVEAMRS